MSEIKWAWWTIGGEELMKLLQRAHDGEEPFLLYAEAYANSKVEKPKNERDKDN